MAWSGLGSGTVGDPYQVTNQSQLAEMGTATYSAADYFLLMNDMSTGTTYQDASTLRLTLYSNFDGSSHKLSLPGNRVDLTNTPCIAFYRSNTYLKNIELSFPDVPPTNIFFFPLGTLANITINDISVYANSFWQYNENPTTFNVFEIDCPSTWNISNLYLEGPFRQIFGNVACSIDDIYVVITTPVKTNTNFFIQNITGYETYVKNCYLKFPSLYMYGGGALFYNVTGTRNIIEQCYVEGEMRGWNTGPIGGTAPTDAIIRNCYFNGSFVDYGEAVNTNMINFIRDVDVSIINNYAYIKSITKALYHSFNSSTYFDDLGYTDWYIPSRDEMSLVISGAGPVYANNMYGSGSQWGYLTSSEVDAANCYTFNYTSAGVTSAKVAANNFYALLLIRNFTYDINDAPEVGQKYLGGYCISRNDASLTGMMTGATWVAEGAKLFDFGSTGSVLNTSTGVGSGITNTALMAAAATTNQSATKWNSTYAYPTFPAYSFYPLSPNWTWNDVSNFCTVISKESNQTISSYDGQVHVSDASLRDVSTFLGWDFSTVWEQTATGKLPSLRDNTEEKPCIGLYSFTKTSTQNLQVTLNYNTDLISSDASVGLIAEIYGGSEIYDATGLVHNIALPDASDYHLVLKPYYLSRVTQIPVYLRDYYFYPYSQSIATYPYVIQNITLNAATIGADIKNVHGSVLLNGYIYGCARFNGAVVKINASDYSDHSYVVPTGTWSLDQIVYCNGFIWGVNGNKLIRFDPSTLAYKTAILGTFTSQNSEPIMTSHDQYLYVAGVQYVYKYDSSCFIGTDISTNCPDSSIGNALLGTYDSYIRGQWLTYNPTYPTYIGSSKGAIHSGLVDGDYLYLAYTTQYGSFFDNSGFNASTGLSGHELHKISINDMSTGTYTIIPKCTDDMDQDLEYVYLGCEVQMLADPSTYGYGCSTLSVRKSDSKVSLLSRDEGPQSNPPLYQSYGVFRRGNYLIDLRTTGNIAVTDLSDTSTWSLSVPINKYTADYLQPNSGIGNDMTIDYNQIYHFFTWAVTGGNPQPSGLYKIRFPSHLVLTAVPMVMTLDGSFAAI